VSTGESEKERVRVMTQDSSGDESAPDIKRKTWGMVKDIFCDTYK
jgi:hypothetical protein